MEEQQNFAPVVPVTSPKVRVRSRSEDPISFCSLTQTLTLFSFHDRQLDKVPVATIRLHNRSFAISPASLMSLATFRNAWRTGPSTRRRGSPSYLT